MNNTLNYYDLNAKSLSKRYESANVENVHELLINTFAIQNQLLELGCGSGRDASFMTQHNYKVLAIDASKEMIEEAKILHPELLESLYVMIIPDTLSFQKESFDGVYSIATLMHLEKNDIEKTIEKIHSYLKPKGKFFFSVSIQRDDLNSKQKDLHGRHFTTLSEEDWMKLCEDKGFKTIKKKVSNDGLNRDGIIWFTCIVEKQ